jgi:hypothetical protein
VNRESVTFRAQKFKLSGDSDKIKTNHRQVKIMKNISYILLYSSLSLTGKVAATSTLSPTGRSALNSSKAVKINKIPVSIVYLPVKISAVFALNKKFNMTS